MFCRGSHWEQLSGTGDFVPQSDTSADVWLCGFLDRRWFLIVLVNKAQPGLAVWWGKSWERSLCWLRR